MTRAVGAAPPGSNEMSIVLTCLLSASPGCPQQPPPDPASRRRELARVVNAEAARHLRRSPRDEVAGNVAVVPLGVSSADIALAQVVEAEVAEVLVAPYVSEHRSPSGLLSDVRDLLGDLQARGGEQWVCGGRVIVPEDLLVAAERARGIADLGWVLERSSSREELWEKAKLVPALPGRAGQSLGGAAVPADEAPALVDRVAVAWFGARMPWEVPFDESESLVGLFHPRPDARVFASFLRREGVSLYGEAGDFTQLRLPLRAKGFVVDVLLPKETLSASALRDPLAAAIDDRGQSSPDLEQARVTVILPSVDVETRMDLVDPARPAGLRQRLRGAQVVGFGIDEAGVGVGSVTRRMPSPGTSERRRVVFHVDRPFVALVRDLESGLVVVAAAITDPGTGGGLDERRR